MTAPSHLVHVTDAQPGIKRLRRGRGFSYVAPDGTTIARGAERKRLEALAVPPAYEDVWMCPMPNGHLQATGRDTRKRKQYRYHPDWAEAQAQTKFDGLVQFGEALPRMRRAVRRDLENEAGDRAYALACAVSLIDKTAIRVGDPAYTRENGSYGAVTLKSRQIRFHGNSIEMRYRAKGGKKVQKRINDKRLAAMLHSISDLPGAQLLSWVDDEGDTQTVSSAALNAYIADAADVEGVTAKTFRTWKGTLAAFEVGQQGDATIKAMAEAASDVLNNTPTIARNSYIHPAVIDMAGGDAWGVEGYQRADLYAAEGRLLKFLEAL
ncbi:DNA topoisomerase [Sulfitobacter noctilucicola]|uniref:DNA topoisomerase n=1 Tax=Sulfitobacter noctilucicola TaxID=1342301 RepID=A0A7W6MAK6_9RHOB|nr:DNA topoisomerase IB [Sulfitobacter noctilucicola]KIN63450.1 DNA topoisomerase [Sulfitobacter noctilucicola]MBB4175038.1 DNA topoisomerase-1 [Sulfitobacter noctilucicola]